MKRPSRRSVWMLLLALTWPALTWPAAARTAWHHPPSPYRAVFEVQSQPTTRDAGYWLQVPISGLGDATGRAVYVFDDQHRAMRVHAVGDSGAGMALVQVQGRRPPSRIYAYWGTDRRAPQNDMLTPGVTLTVRTLPDDAKLDSWAHCRQAYEQSDILGVQPLRQIELAGNPLTTHERYILEVNGRFQQERGAKPELFLAHHGAAFLWIDDKQVIDRPGRHHPNQFRQGEGRQAIALHEGLTPLRLLLFFQSSREVAVLASYEGPRQMKALPPSAFAQPGTTSLTTVETQHDRQLCPAFRVEHVAYLSIDDTVYTLLDCHTWTGAEVEWATSDGGHAKGASYRLVRVGLEPLSISARRDGRSRETAQIDVHFATVPQRFISRNEKHFAQFRDAILGRELGGLDVATLQAYLALLETRDRHPASVPVAQAILNHPQRRQLADLLPVHLALARSTAAETPDTAADAYQQVMRLTRDEALILEAIEFLIYRQGDLDTARQRLAQAARVIGRQHLQLTRYQGEIALLSGDVEAARDAFTEIQQRLQAEGRRRDALVQASEHIERFRSHLSQAHWLAAEADLRELGVLTPSMVASGQYAVLRSRLCRAIGWPTSVPGLVDRTLAYNSLPAHLPELELQKALALAELGRHDEARASFQRIRDHYPNHPAASTASQHLQN